MYVLLSSSQQVLINKCFTIDVKMLLLLLNTRKNVKIIRNRALNKIVGFSPQQSLSYKLTLIKKNKKRLTTTKKVSLKNISIIIVERNHQSVVTTKDKKINPFFLCFLIWTPFLITRPFSLQSNFIPF